MASEKLADKAAIVTGGASGFGLGIVKKFLQQGAKVVVADLAEDAGKKAASDLGADFFQINVTVKDDWVKLVGFCDQNFGKIDIVVNNAGTTYTNKPTNDVSDEDFDKVFNVNVKAIYYSTNVIIPYMQERGHGGSFVTVASTAGIRPRPGLTWYNASKAAAITATKTLAVEFAKDKIRFNSVCPVLGLGTGLTNAFLGKPENEKAFLATVPLGRGSTPEDVANACSYLASDEASFITGIQIPVDGGRCV